MRGNPDSQASSLGEFQRLIQLALPVMAAQLAQMGMGVLDTIMAGRVSAVDLAGVALGGSVLFPLTMVMMGVLQSVSPTVAQLHGANRGAEIGQIVRQGLWMALLAALLIYLIIQNAQRYYEWMSVDPTAVEVSVTYLGYAVLGAPAVMSYFVLRFMVEGVGFTRPAMVIVVNALILKVPLNLLFIHGGFGIDAMGGAGCGLSTAIVMWFQLAMMLLVANRANLKFTGFSEKFDRPNWQIIKSLLIIGLPIGATLFFEVGLFSTMTILAGGLGAEVVAAHSTAMSVGGLTFMIPLALGMATTIRVGFNIGSGQVALARTTAKVALLSALGIAMVSISTIVFFRYQIVDFYTNDTVVLETAATLILFVAVFQLFDHSQVVAMGALRGYKDTRVPMIVTFVCYWLVGLPISCLLGYGWLGEPLGVYGFWIGLIISLVVVSIVICGRLWKVSRQFSAD